MPLFISQRDVCDITGVSSQTVNSHLSHSPIHRIDKHPFYYVTDVCNFLNRHAKKYIERLAYAAEDDNELYCGVDSLMVAESFDIFVSKDVRMDARAKSVRNSFFNTLALADGARTYMTYTESLRLKLLLNGGISRFILTGENSELPIWYSFSPAFALVNSGLDSAKVAA